MKLLKTTLIIFALFVIYSTQSFSQSIGLGIESGINIGDISSSPAFNTTTKTGFMVGGFADIGVTDIFAVRPGLRYITKGFTSTFNGVSFTDNLSYLEVPLLLKVSVPLPRVKPYFMAGPTLGIQLSANETFGTGAQAQDLDASQIYETIDFGLHFGGGIDFHVASKMEIFTGFGYSLGLTNISKLTTSARNHGLQITSGVKFNI